MATVIVLGCPAVAAVRQVPADYPTIQAGINACAPSDTVLVEAGNYAENIDFPAFDITVASRYLLTGDPADIAATQIHSAAYHIPIVFIGLGQTRSARLCGFTISGGMGLQGSGVHCAGTSPTIDHNTITNNCPQYNGGGIRVDDGSPLIHHNDITGN
jgi:hypothetical protein